MARHRYLWHVLRASPLPWSSSLCQTRTFQIPCSASCLIPVSGRCHRTHIRGEDPEAQRGAPMALPGIQPNSRSDSVTWEHELSALRRWSQQAVVPGRAKTTWRCEQAGGAWRARRSGSPGPSEEPQRFLQAAGHVVCRCPELASTPASVCICVRAVWLACLCRCTAAPLVRGGCVPGPPVDAQNRGQHQTPRAHRPAVHV